jgi:hypothetical protein
MARSACEEVMVKAVPDLTDGELERLITELRAAKRERESGIKADSLQDPAMAAADDVYNGMKIAAVIEKRNAYLNLQVRMRAESFIRQFPATAKGFREGAFALVAGTERLKVGGRASAAAEQKQFAGEWIGALAHDLDKAGLREVFTAGAMDRDIARALWQLGKDTPDMRGLADQAVDIAKIVHTYQEASRLTRNRFGSWIGKLDGYIVRQSHDMYKIHAAGFDQWRGEIEPRLDWRRIESENPELNRDAFLRGVFDDLSSGDHMNAIPGAEMAGFKGPSNIAKRASQSRTLHFLDADAWFDYNAKFGVGNLNEAVLTGLQSAAKQAGIMKVLGTNPQANLEAAMSRVADTLKGQERGQFSDMQRQVIDMLAHVDGRASIPGNATAAKVGANLRAWQSISKLGGAVITSITDVPVYASEVRYAQGKGFLSGITEAIGGVLQGRPKGEQADMLASLGVFHESMLGEVFARFDAQDLTGKGMTWAMQKFFRMNGLTWWTESLRSASALSSAHYMALQAGKAWDGLPESAARTLSLYGIDSGKWDLLRQSGVKLADDRPYLTPEGMQAVSRADLTAYLASKGLPASERAAENLRADLAASLRSFYIDRAHHAVIEPDARSRWWLQRGTQPGTVEGELLRYISQFKSFPTALMHKVFGRELYGYGADTARQAGMTEFTGIAQLVLYTTLFGYAAMSIKDLLKGREPRDPLSPKTMGAAMMQGGAMGIYGDFVLGESSRFGRSLLETLGGPVLSTVADIDELRARLMNGDDVASSAMKTVVSNTPFVNLFYVKPALDYLVLYEIQEAMNPGYLRRMEARIQKENNQEFWLRPSEVAR